MNLTTAFDNFLKHCERQGLSHHTCRAYSSDLNDFQKWFHGAEKAKMDKVAIGLWISDMRKRGLGPATIRRRVACLKVTCRWLAEEGLLPTNPFHHLRTRIRIPKTLPKALNHSELEALLRQASREADDALGLSKLTIWLAVEMLFATGIRVSELCGILPQRPRLGKRHHPHPRQGEPGALCLPRGFWGPSPAQALLA